MKTMNWPLILIFLAVACNKSTEKTTVIKETTNSTNVNGSGSGGSGGSGSSSSGSSCLGTTADGYDDSVAGALGRVPFFNLDINLPGEGKTATAVNDWTPGITGNAYTTQFSPPIPTVDEARIMFDSDSRLRVRIKVLAENYDCPGRRSGSTDPYPYKNLMFTVNIKPITASGTVSSSILKSISVGPVAVNSCSNIIDLPIITSTYGNVVEIADVKSDSDCQGYTASPTVYDPNVCPYTKVREMACWRATLQVVNDSTYNFK